MTSKSKSPKSSSRNLPKSSVPESKKLPPNSFNLLNEQICTNLLESTNILDIEDLIITNFKLESADTDLKSAIIADFYVHLVLWLRETFSLDAAKFSLMFAAVHYLFDNIRNNNVRLKDSIVEFKNMLVGEDENNSSPHNKHLSSLKTEEIKALNEFIFMGFVQHHKLMEYVFSYHRSSTVLGLDITVETLPLDKTPYPTPLCEALDSECFEKCLASDGSIRSQSVKSADLDNELRNDIDFQVELEHFSNLPFDTIGRIMKEECSNIFPQATAEMDIKISDIECNFLKEISKLQKLT